MKFLSAKHVDFALYVHVPFCVAKCGYCSFYSLPFAESAAEVWLLAVTREAKRLAEIWGAPPPLRTIYIGGGTPSVLPLVLWKRLLHVLEDVFDLSSLREATVEANPCSLKNEHLRLWRDSFLTRISLGVQSLHNNELLRLGRLHDAPMALQALEESLSFGFDVSADLIFGLPLQTLRTWNDSLRRVVAAGALHVSVYQLTLEPGTPMGDDAPPLPDGYSFYRLTQWYLARKGLPQYEISSFSRLGKECLHNLAYWRQENVLALGPAAWGYLDGFRYRNASTLESYAAATETGLAVDWAEFLEGRSRGIEAAIIALRTKWGIDVNSFSKRFGSDLTGEVLNVLSGIPKRLTHLNPGCFALTPSGMRVGNAIWTELLELDS